MGLNQKRHIAHDIVVVRWPHCRQGTLAEPLQDDHRLAGFLFSRFYSIQNTLYLFCV